MPKSSPEPVQDPAEGTELVVSVPQLDAEPATEHRYSGSQLTFETMNGQLRIFKQQAGAWNDAVVWAYYPAGSWRWCRRVDVAKDPQSERAQRYSLLQRRFEQLPDDTVTPIL